MKPLCHNICDVELANPAEFFATKRVKYEQEPARDVHTWFTEFDAQGRLGNLDAVPGVLRTHYKRTPIIFGWDAFVKLPIGELVLHYERFLNKE